MLASVNGIRSKYIFIYEKIMGLDHYLSPYIKINSR